MQTVTLDKGELTDILKINRKKHVAEFKEAEDSYRKAAVDWFKTQLAEAKGKRHFDIYFDDETPPVSHVDAYDQILEELEMEVNPEVKLTSSEFNTYVRDNWGWQSDFKKSAVYYNTVVGKEVF